MKKGILLLVSMMVCVGTLYCQVPEAINFQSVVRDASGNLIVSQPVSFRLSILQNNPLGTAVYVETHTKTTNQFGMASMEVGRGTIVSGDFSVISWGSDDFYLKTEIDPAGGTNYQALGTAQFLSVPYALYAKTAGNASFPGGTTGQTIRHDGYGWVPDDNLFNTGNQIGVGTTMPDNSAALDVTADDKGFLPPRMTHLQVNEIVSPAEGLIIFCTDCGPGVTGRFVGFMNGKWILLATECLGPVPPAPGIHIPSPTQVVWNWSSVLYATGYKWNTVNDYNTALDMGTGTTKTEDGLVCNTNYTRYAWSYNECGPSAATALNQTTSMDPPPTPTAGTHTPSPTQIIWNWNTVPNATGYKWNTTNDYGSAEDMGSNTSKTETGLTCNTEYTRYVWAYSNCGVSLAGTLTQTTSLDPPAAPTAGTHVPSPTQIIWNWNTVPNVSGYKWNTSNDYGSAEEMGLNTAKTETGLTCNTEYTRYVWAYSNCGVSQVGTLTQTTSLDPPIAPTAGTHVPSPTQIIWNWNSVPNATGYKWNTTDDYGSADEMGSNTSKTETGLTCNTAYTRYVWAYSNCGVSLAGTLTQTTSLDPPAPPTAGTHVPTATQITWNWNSVPLATGYKWGVTDDFDFAEDVGTNLSYTEMELICSTEYTRYVWAYSNCGNSVSAALIQTTLDDPPPAPAEGTHVPDVTQIVWNWAAVPGATGYKWNLTEDYNTATDMGTATTKTETGLTCNTEYTRYVWAYSSCGVSVAGVLSESTLPDPPATPTEGIHVPSATQIVWNWNAVPLATGYKWNTTNDYNTATDMGTVTTKTETGLTCNTPYTRFVWAYNQCGVSVSLSMNETTSMDPPPAPSAGTHVPSITQIVWNWNTVPQATGYKWSTTSDYNTATDMGTQTSKTETGLTCYTSYTRYVWAYGNCGVSDSTILTQSTSMDPPASPTAGTHEPSVTQIIWKWNTVPLATGYKWNTINDYNTATDKGTATSHTELGLSCNTGYTRYVWAYSACGYSTPVTLSDSTVSCPLPCGLPVLDERDSRSYNTVQIGSQCWMKENMKIGTMIPHTTQMADNGILERYCWDGNVTDCEEWGAYYEFHEALQWNINPGVQGICPPGWHIPTEPEAVTLQSFLGGWSVAGGKIKEAGYVHWQSPNTGATNSSGFTLLGCGWHDCDNYFRRRNQTGGFWTSTTCRSTVCEYDDPWLEFASPHFWCEAIPVRCLRDNCTNIPTTSDAGPDQLNLTNLNTTMAGNTPTSGNGLWSIISGSGAILSEPTNPTSDFVGIAGTSYTLTWTISTNCAGSIDTVIISYSPSATNCVVSFVDPRDNTTYEAVQVGTQCWMKENLNIGTRIDVGVTPTYDAIIEKYCYNDLVSNCDEYGGLYTWAEMMNHTMIPGTIGICPTGWHVPTNEEWLVMINFLGGLEVAGGKLKEAGSTHWTVPNTGATNESGFTALPGGARHGDAYYYYLYGSGYFWTSTTYGYEYAWYNSLIYNVASVNHNYNYRSRGMSVRCLKDQ